MICDAAGVDQTHLISADHLLGGLDALGVQAMDLFGREHLVHPRHARDRLYGSDFDAGSDRVGFDLAKGVVLTETCSS